MSLAANIYRWKYDARHFQSVILTTVYHVEMLPRAELIYLHVYEGQGYLSQPDPAPYGAEYERGRDQGSLDALHRLVCTVECFLDEKHREEGGAWLGVA